MLYGLDKQIKEIYNYSEIFLKLDTERLKKFKELSIHPTFLFYGYPATGKSTVANIVYEKLKENNNIDIYRLNIDELLSSNFGESAKNLREYFIKIEKEIEKNKSNAFIIMDEIDSFTLNRSNTDNESIKRVLLTFNTIIDELIQTNEIFKYIIISTTNLKDSLDTSILRRFYFKENFNIELNNTEFNEFLNKILELIDIQIDDEIKKKLYDIYKSKKYTLGEVKVIFSRYYIDSIIEKSDISHLIENFQKYQTFHEIIKIQNKEK